MIDLPTIRTHTVARIKKLAAVAKEEFALVTPEEKKRRIDTCHACPHLMRAPFERCAVMHCMCPIITKLSLQRAHCPDNPPRW